MHSWGLVEPIIGNMHSPHQAIYIIILSTAAGRSDKVHNGLPLIFPEFNPPQLLHLVLNPEILHLTL